MSSDLTTESVRLALHVAQTRAEVSGNNISTAGTANAKTVRVDSGFASKLLSSAITENDNTDLASSIRKLSDEQDSVSLRTEEAPVNLDEQVAELSSANLEYTALVDVLNRRFGLMRLAISGRNQ